MIDNLYTCTEKVAENGLKCLVVLEEKKVAAEGIEPT